MRSKSLLASGDVRNKQVYEGIKLQKANACPLLVGVFNFAKQFFLFIKGKFFFFQTLIVVNISPDEIIGAGTLCLCHLTHKAAGIVLKHNTWQHLLCFTIVPHNISQLVFGIVIIIVGFYNPVVLFPAFLYNISNIFILFIGIFLISIYFNLSATFVTLGHAIPRFTPRRRANSTRSDKKPRKFFFS